MLNLFALTADVKLSVVLLSLMHTISEGTLPFPDIPPNYSSGDLWAERSMFCLYNDKNSNEVYYGIIFSNFKTRTVIIDNGHLMVPQETEASHYTLVTIYGAQKVFWKNKLGVNSLDRKNFVHLLNGKEHGWCQPQPSLVVFQKLQEKLTSDTSKNRSRTILDDFQ